MEGRPVWLASISLRNHRREIIPTDRWRHMQKKEAQALLAEALRGVGDDSRERCFRMCITLCVHRALSDEELVVLPDSWWCTPARDLAGGPLEVLWAKGIPDAPSTRPCAQPRKTPLPGLRGAGGCTLFIPEDCGACESCRARESVRTATAAGLRGGAP